MKVALKTTVTTFSRTAEMQNLTQPLKRGPQKELEKGKNYLFHYLLASYYILMWEKTISIVSVNEVKYTKD